MRGVSCGYGDRVILSNVDLDLHRGQVIGVMGTSGGGKTTLLRLIGRQLTPISGQVMFDGVDIATLDRKGLYALRRRMGCSSSARSSPIFRCSTTWPSHCASTPTSANR